MDKQRQARLIALTEGGYSFDRYSSWGELVKQCMAEGWSDKQIEAVLLSKWTRWAADESEKPYGRTTARDVMPILREYAKNGKLEQLTKEHHGE